jgi:hypothetical protein
VSRAGKRAKRPEVAILGLCGRWRFVHLNTILQFPVFDTFWGNMGGHRTRHSPIYPCRKRAAGSATDRPARAAGSGEGNVSRGCTRSRPTPALTTRPWQPGDRPPAYALSLVPFDKSKPLHPRPRGRSTQEGKDAGRTARLVFPDPPRAVCAKPPATPGLPTTPFANVRPRVTTGPPHRAADHNPRQLRQDKGTGSRYENATETERVKVKWWGLMAPAA